MRKVLIITWGLLLISFAQPCLGQDYHYVTCGGGGWIYVSGQTVTIGSIIRIVNYCYDYPLTFYQLGSTPCDYWEETAGGYGGIVFVDTAGCDPGTMYFQTNPLVHAEDGELFLVPPPTPTSTPDPNLPAMSPTGAGLTLILAGLILALSTLRRMA